MQIAVDIHSRYRHPLAVVLERQAHLPQPIHHLPHRVPPILQRPLRPEHLQQLVLRHPLPGTRRQVQRDREQRLGPKADAVLANADLGRPEHPNHYLPRVRGS
jgi:hypothetical protein